MVIDFVGIVCIVLVLLLSKRLGWNPDPARNLLLGSALLFALGIVLPAFALEGKASTWLLLSTLVTAFGAVTLVVAVLSFTRVAAPPQPEKTRPPVPPAPPPSPRHEPRPDDPLAGPHGDRG